MATEQVRIIKDHATPEPDEILAAAIIKISEAMDRLNRGPLKRDTIVLLIHDHTKIARRDIGAVLNTLDSLQRIYLKAPATPAGKK
jgi:hypothetical protein